MKRAKNKNKRKTLFNRNIQIVLFLCLMIIFTSCHNNNTQTGSKEENINEHEIAKSATINKDENLYPVEAPPFSEGIFPCSDCHSNQEPNPIRRPLVDMHDDIDAMFNHDSENRWCLDCHDMNNRDFLKLASGKLIGFDESYKLCGQCHGDKLRDWKVGVHGKRTGNWNGEKQYLLCVHCHNPHTPKFKPIKPMPPPVQQKDIN